MRMLIVEDDVTLSHLLVSIFSQSDEVEIYVTDKLASARTISRNQKPYLTMLDLALPDSSPENTARVGVRELKEDNPDGVLLVMTGYASPANRESAIANGADAVIEKGPNMRKAELAKGISEAFQHHGGAFEGFICLIEGLLGVKLCNKLGDTLKEQ